MPRNGLLNESGNIWNDALPKKSESILCERRSAFHLCPARCSVDSGIWPKSNPTIADVPGLDTAYAEKAPSFSVLDDAVGATVAFRQAHQSSARAFMNYSGDGFAMKDAESVHMLLSATMPLTHLHARPPLTEGP